tara:strand:- start:1938 stop:3515 length:1578 start_codon:yes stop_codon:yes gene_type:complete
MTNQIKTVITAQNKTARAFAQVNQSLNRINKHLDKTNGNLGRIKKSFGNIRNLAISALAVRQFVKYSDFYTNISNRLALVTKNTRELEQVTNSLFKTAQTTRTSFEATSELYARIALSSKELGASHKQLLVVTKALNQATILSGASTQEANNALIQLSQGLASGTLRGDELRSVLEQLPLVADTIAKHMGITRGELRKVGADGKISAEIVLNAFLKASQTLDAQFSKTLPSISQAFQTLTNALGKFINRVNKTTHASKLLAKSLIRIGKILEFLAKTGSRGFFIKMKVSIAELLKKLSLLNLKVAKAFNWGEGAKQNKEYIKTINMLLKQYESRLSQIAGIEEEMSTTDFSPTVSALKGLSEQAEIAEKLMKSTSRTIEDSLVDAFKNSGQSITKLFKNTVNAIITETYRLAVIRPLISSIMQGIGTSFPKFSGTSAIPKPRANGGLVQAGSPYMVGESGKELFVPNQSGRIEPNNNLGTNIVQNINLNISALDGADVVRVLTSDEGRETIEATFLNFQSQRGLA